ncbi:L-serine ammonia-lyase, iron-sulfur-dependent, subunit alpha [Schnuerera sp. xch1]|uniref:L-cysteine desulfidase family protein n=1 Tax=Schnuerera sp. xch1 TaxID=2874283 RepID=UPI001CBEF32F|nr:L-serine ammonia-lyase, iron-sulfur-dependent, subunit alpha [Schnuerera sp. xch1]MBZ2174611.1 L-serine ammonia-lyase, iron-sulfur-dependent, subunit alpha [Schnuerera sp. xch1]
MKDSQKLDNLLWTIKKDIFPAIGCTEPIAVAYAAAVANKYLTGNMDSMLIKVSKNIFKNGKFVVVPSTNEYGLDLAGALGALVGDPEKGFMVLKDVNEDVIESAHQIIDSGKIKSEYVEGDSDVYVDIVVNSYSDVVEVELKDSHTHIEKIVVGGETVYEAKLSNDNIVSCEFLKNMTFKEIREVCEIIPLEKLEFIQEGIDMNKKAAERGISENKGLNIGATLKRLLEKKRLSMDAPTKARILTAAAADIRMGGGCCPIMTSGGSGNQGLGVVLPIMVVAEDEGIERERLIRAVFLGHIVNKFVKTYTGKLSGMCGCAIAAGIGASAGISWMLGGKDEQISGTCNNMLANLTGMICDGAKESCALKLATSASESVISAYLANENIIVKNNVGIIGENIEETIKNTGILCKEVFTHADEVIVDMIK